MNTHRPSPANGFRKQVPAAPRLSIREAVAQWGDDWVWFSPTEFSRQRIQDDQRRDWDYYTMRLCEGGKMSRIREEEIAEGERLERGAS